MFVDAVLAPGARVSTVPAGVQRMYASALVRELLLRWRELLLRPSDLAHLFSHGPDIYGEPGDRLPALYQFLSYSRVLSYRLRHHGARRRALKAAYFEGITWNGTALP
jgi:hypothetical protein